VSKLAPCSMAYEQRPVGRGSALLIRTASPRVLPAVPWPKDGLHLVVLHLDAAPPPELVAMLTPLRLALGSNLLCLAWHGTSDAHHDAYAALRLTGHTLRGRTTDCSFSCWSGSEPPDQLPVVTEPVLRHGDLSNHLAKILLRSDTKEVLEIWPRRGRFTAAAVRAGCKTTVVAYPTDSAYDRLTNFLDSRKR
jgi:hypothetical protein